MAIVFWSGDNIKRHHKLTLASLAVVTGITAGVLTIVEKSIDIVNSLSEKPEASQIPEGYQSEKGFAGGIQTGESKQLARMSKW